MVAYHEVGHALVAALEKHSQPVSKITIVPHTSGALGYTMQMPEEEKYLSTRDELLVELRTLVGGRAAEEVAFGVQTTGAANDIQRATDLARRMVAQFGMSSRFGPHGSGHGAERVSGGAILYGLLPDHCRADGPRGPVLFLWLLRGLAPKPPPPPTPPPWGGGLSTF